MEKNEIMQENAVLAQTETLAEEETAQKKFVLSEEELNQIAIIAAHEGAEKGVAAYKKEQEAAKVEYAERVKNSAKTLIIHYRRLKKMKDTSVCDTDTVTDPTLAEIFDNILDQVRRDEFNLTSTNRNRIITGMMMNHVDVQLENYRKECEKSKVPEVERRYRVVEMMFLQEQAMRADEVAEVEMIDKSSVYRTLEKAYEDLAVLFFGIEGVKISEIKKKKRASKKDSAKKMHL